METLNDYFRLKEYDRIELEKKCMVDLKKVIDVCLKKGHHFSVNKNTNQIDVSTDDFETNLVSYFKGRLINHKSQYAMPISELLEKLKQS
jgi:hypothetical protein